MTTYENYLKQIQYELNETPVEYLPDLLSMIHNFRERMCSKNNAVDSFSQGWRELQDENYQPIQNLWDDVKK
jgi:hypothetical protein